MQKFTEDVSELVVDPKHHTMKLPRPQPESLKVYDTTLRDGEQMPGIALSPQQKYRLAREISDLGCHVLELCFPVISKGEHELLELTAEGRRRGEIREDLQISVMCRSSKTDIDKTIAIIEKAGFSTSEITFELFTSSSLLHLKYKLGPMLLKREGIDAERLQEMPLDFFHEANKRLVAEAVTYARERGVSHIEFGGEDASRTNVEHLIETAQVSIEAGASRFIFADTIGCLTPEATRYYCSALSEALPGVERVVHFHDDFGLAAANTITAVLNGFPMFATTINGIGERAGNAPLHSIAAALRYLYGLEIPRFHYERLHHVKSVVEELSGVPVSAKEPIIGRNVYTHESGIHTHGMSISPLLYEQIPCEQVGGQSRFVYGKHSGTSSLVRLLEKHEEEIGREASLEFAQQVLDEIKAERQSLINTIDTRRYVEEYYANLDRLGFSEDEVVELARRTVEHGRMVAVGA